VNNYRPDIDGLRAIAVLSVVFYHAGLGFPGGYVGVDVFFVISGYLITALILKDLERGSFSMAIFWERRIRRIFPALAAMVAVTCVAGWFLLLPEDLAKLGASVIAQSLLVSNFYFWRTTNYFGGANEEKPLLHTWSLAVEEQFYLIFPIALMAIWAFFNYRLKKRDERNLTTIERGGRCEKEQPKVGPKGEGVGTSESKDTECTEFKAGARLGKPSGAAFSNPSTSELARDCANTVPTRSASVSASLQTTSNPLPATSPIGEQRRWTLFWMFAAVALVSFGISIWGVKAQPFATFFLLPTRAWELLLGSMLAVLPPTVVVRSSALREILCLAGLAGIFIPVFFYGEQTPFPGLAAFPPCLGTAALIWANTSSSRDSQRGWTAKALSWSPIVFIGLISYSLYLWHWPVICFSSYWAVSEFTGVEKCGLVLASVVLADASWRWVETPFRKKQYFTTRSHVMGLALIISLVSGFVGWLGYQSGGFPERVNSQVLAVLEDLEKDQADRQKLSYLAPNITDYSQANLRNLPRIGQQDGTPLSFAVLGDSHAQVAMPLFDELAKKHQKSGVAITHQGTPPLLGWQITQKGGAADPAGLWNAAFEFIQAEKIQDVFLLGYWSSYDQGEIDRKAVETIEKFSNAGINVWVLMGAPTYHQNVARMYLRNIFFRNKGTQTESVVQHNQKPQDIGVFGGVQKTFTDRIIGVSDGFLDRESGKNRLTINNYLLYFDSNHLTIEGNKAAYSDKIAAIFARGSQQPPQ
jgi:peptidoglycan/LPS O-acetylase OafA/YrhL